jgi:LmbE family N-acetylglucosaminyl deacetylase
MTTQSEETLSASCHSFLDEEERKPGGRSLLAVFAHPDDESFGPGGTLAKYAAEGVGVFLITATRGEAGMTGGLPINGPQELSQVREQELMCSCRVLGIRRLCFLDYLDGRLDSYDPLEVEGKIVRLMREIRPQVVITFGPDGISGHPDHMAISRLTTAAFRSAGLPERFPEHLQEGLDLHQPARLYYLTLPQSQVEELGRAGISGTPDENITTILDVSAYAETKVKALHCHRTQVSDYTRFLENTPRKRLEKEYYSLAIPAPERKDGVETDLFAGLN